MSIMICVPVYNRKMITELALENLQKYKGDGNELWVYNDWSTEYDNDFIEPLCDRVVKLPASKSVVVKNENNKNGMGVASLRWQQFRDFLREDRFDYIYFTDSDAIHDPNFINILLETYNKYKLKNGDKIPICLYDTVWHSQPQNLLKDGVDVYMRRYAPGISHFYSKDMVKKIVSVLDSLSEVKIYGWDYQTSDYLKLPFITTKISYVEHFGAVKESMHTPQGQWDRDRANNPTQYLQDNRNSIISYLEGVGQKPNI